jgi:ParB family chromosome partitioning protein
MAKATKKKAAKKKSTRRKKPAAGSRGIEAAELGEGDAGAAVEALSAAISEDGGSVLATYKDPIGGAWQLLAGLPIDKVEPTPFQRDLSDTHAKRMTQVIDKLDRFLDPILAVRTQEGRYWTPNGLHRLTAVKNLGGKSIVALVVPEFDLCYKILALNTEKSHNLKEKSLEVVRMARALSEIAPRPESEFGLEFEEPTFMTLGLAYEKRARFSGSAYQPAIKKVDRFMDEPLGEVLETRAGWADLLLQIDDQVAAHIKALKSRGFDSPYLKNFVVARINPRASGEESCGEVLEKMLAKAQAFDPGGVKDDDV